MSYPDRNSKAAEAKRQEAHNNHERLFMEIVQDKEIQHLMALVVARIGDIWSEKFNKASGPNYGEREDAFIKFLTEELVIDPQAEPTGDESIYAEIISYAKVLKNV
jgi:hypothetical protein